MLLITEDLALEDTPLFKMMVQKKVEPLQEAIAEKDNLIHEKDSQLHEKDNLIHEKDSQLHKKSTVGEMLVKCNGHFETAAKNLNMTVEEIKAILIS